MNKKEGVWKKRERDNDMEQTGNDLNLKKDKTRGGSKGTGVPYNQSGGKGGSHRKKKGCTGIAENSERGKKVGEKKENLGTP